MNPSLCPPQTPPTWRLLVILAAAACAAFAAEPGVRNFDLPADTATRSLKVFAEQSGTEVLVSSELAQRVRTMAVRGEMAPRAALDAMLQGTGLEAVVDPRSGAIAIREEADASKNVVSRQAGSPAANGDGTVKLQEYEVTGSRIRGLLGEATVQPVLTLTAQDIERTGATSIGEVFRYVPQVSSYTEGQFQQSPNAFGASTGNETSARVTASLRGSPSGGTLLLINGRRAPRNGQQQGLDGYDVGGIPLSAVERVEVLLDGASAVYGADAVGGVINIILKRNYRSTDVRLSYENTFETDVNVKSVSITHGFSHGKLSGMVTAEYQESGSLMWRDRDFLRTQDRRPWGATTNNTAAQIPSANGTINLPAGNAAGLPAGTLVTIPAGSNGTNRTPAQFAAAGSPPAPPGTDLAIWAAYNSPIFRESMVGSFDYAIRPGLEAFAEVRASDNQTRAMGSPVAVSSLSIPASAPGNVFGVPVTMRRYLVDMPTLARVSRTRNVGTVLGLRGELPHDWRFEGALSYNYSRPEFLDPVGFQISSAAFNAALANPDVSRRPNLFYDAVSGVNPNAPGVLESLYSGSQNLERSISWTYEVQADGPIIDLWAGEVRAAVGAEYREEYVDFPRVDASDTFSARPGNRDVTGVFAEVRVPLLSEKQNLPFVHSLEVSAAMRQDGYDDFDDATTPRYSAGFRPFRWLLARASYGEGYKVPTLSQVSAPIRNSEIFFSVANPPRDPYRGNTPFIMQVMPIISGGNPDLVPEETESTTAGIVLEVPHRWFKGLSLSYDYYDHNYVNRISPSLSLADRLDIFPELFTRGANLPGDLPGWPGPILSYDNRAVNVSTNRITGWDGGIKYLRPTPWGDFLVMGNVSKAYRNENRARPGAPPATNAVPQALPLRASGSVFWSKNGFETGALFSYRDVFKRNLTERLTPSSIRWDFRVGYDFKQSSWARSDADRWYKRAFADTRVSVTLYNVLDDEPPMNSSGLPDSSIIDALGRRYVISLTKSFGEGRR